MSAKKSAKTTAKAEPKKAEPKKADPKKAEPEGSDATAQAKADALTSQLGEVQEVRFGKIKNDQQVRRLLSKEGQEEIFTSVSKGGVQERLVVFLDDDGNYQTISGGRRLRAMVKAGISPDAMISVIVKPKPKNTAARVVAGAKANIHERMVWPDLAFVVGAATGAIDEDGKPTKVANLSERMAAERGLYTSAQLAEEFGLAQVTINTYQRIARAPYEDLVKIYEAGGSMAHGDRYAAYADRDKPEALAHYLQFRDWPETIQPQRRRAESEKVAAKRAAKNGADPKVQASLVGKGKQRPAPPASGKTTWTDESKPAAAAPAAAPQIGTFFQGKQASFLGDAPTPPRGSASAPEDATDPDQRGRRAGELEELADHFGLPLELAELLDAAIDHWPHYGLETAAASDVTAMEQAIERYNKAAAS